MSEPRKLRLTVEYDGTDFHGWQRQIGLRTVQATLEDTLFQLIGERTEVRGPTRFEVRERGLTVASDDDLAFTAALHELLANCDLCRSLGTRGRAHVTAMHDKRRFTDSIARLYRDIRPLQRD